MCDYFVFNSTTFVLFQMSYKKVQSHTKVFITESLYISPGDGGRRSSTLEGLQTLMLSFTSPDDI